MIHTADIHQQHALHAGSLVGPVRRPSLPAVEVLSARQEYVAIRLHGLQPRWLTITPEVDATDEDCAFEDLRVLGRHHARDPAAA